MHSRLIATLLLLASIAKGYPGYGQQIISDVPVSWIGGYLWAGHQNGFHCGQKGELFYRPDFRPKDETEAVVRVNPDGSTLLFQVPDRLNSVLTFAPVNNGLAAVGRVLVAGLRPTDGPSQELRLYHFDDEGKLVGQRPISLSLSPLSLVVMPTGKTIVVGMLAPYTSKREKMRFGGAVLDANDKVIQQFEFPPTAEGENWGPALGLVVDGDGAAYTIVSVWPQKKFGIAKITEAGRVDITELPVPPPVPPSGEWKAGTRLPGQWLLGSGVAVEQYGIYREYPNLTRFNEYDLASSKRLRTRSTPPPDFPISCYLGDRIVGVARRGPGDQPSIHRVTVKLEATQLHD